MRNLSMKKLGTPIGAGPGRASESVGLPRVGVPSGWVRPAATFALATASGGFLAASAFGIAGAAGPSRAAGAGTGARRRRGLLAAVGVDLHGHGRLGRRRGGRGCGLRG